MKKIFKKILTIILPTVLMPVLIYFMRDGKDILDGLYFVFPIMYIVIGAISSSFVWELLPSAIFTSIAFLIPINLWFHMGSCIESALIYTLFACVSYMVKKLIEKKLKKRKN